MTSRFSCLYLFLFFLTTVNAEITGFPFKNEKQEQRFRELSSELRCLVCQNQSLADSNAGLAQDLRSELYQQVVSGNSNNQIINFMTKRYGDFILYKPRFATKTLLLWITPIILFIVGFFCLVRFSKFKNHPQKKEIPEADLQKIRVLLQAEEEKK